MTGSAEEQELKDRLSLIESMIAEGRQKTESWGWTFVLWGLAYYFAIAWSAWGHSTLAWPVTMIVSFVLTAVVAARMRSARPATTLSRAISSIWIAMGVSIFVLMLSLGISGRLEAHASVAIVGAMLGMANAASSMILKWKMQFACAVAWWAAAVAACFSSDNQTNVAFLAAIFFCQIVFGIYGMVREAHKRRLSGDKPSVNTQGPAHA